MTIITGEANLAPGTAARRHHAVGQPNYVARRIAVAAAAVMAAAIVFAVVMTAVASLAGFGGAPAVASEAQPAFSGASIHVARDGDTLWSIAAEHRGTVDHSGYLYTLIELNGGTVIDVGQAVRLP